MAKRITIENLTVASDRKAISQSLPAIPTPTQVVDVKRSIILEELSPKEEERLKICHERIMQGLKTWFDVGLALAEIRDNKLYRKTHKTFEEFLDENYSIGRTRAHQIISATTLQLMPEFTEIEVVESQLPDSLTPLLELGKIKKSDQLTVWQQVVSDAKKTGEQITAKVVNDTYKRIKQERTTSNPESRTHNLLLSGEQNQSESVPSLKGLLQKSLSGEITITIRGSFLIRNKLTDFWRQQRGFTDIDEDFKDTITLEEATAYGFFKQ